MPTARGLAPVPVTRAAAGDVVVAAAEARQEAGDRLRRPAAAAAAGSGFADGGAVADDGHDALQDLVILGGLRVSCSVGAFRVGFGVEG